MTDQGKTHPAILAMARFITKQAERSIKAKEELPTAKDKRKGR